MRAGPAMSMAAILLCGCHSSRMPAQDLSFQQLVYESDEPGNRPDVPFFDGVIDDQSNRVMVEARAGIQKHRRGRYTVRLVDPTGNPVQGKATFRLVRHDFDWGVNLQGWIKPDAGFLGKCYTAADELFNTARDGTFFRNMVRNAKGPDDPFVYDGVDEHPHSVGWAHDRGIKLRWHCLFYHHAKGRMPDWTPDVPTEEAWWPILERYVTTLAARNKGWFTEYDVINEMFTCGGSYKRINSKHPDLRNVDNAKRLFEMTRKALPDAKLVALEWWALGKNAETHGGPQHWHQILEFYRELVASGAPVDYLGAQCHFGPHDWDQLRMVNLSAHLDLFGSLGKPLVITEYTDPSPHKGADPQTVCMNEDELAAWSANFLSLAYSKPYIRGFTRWQFVDGWGGATANAGLLTAEGRLKPQYRTMQHLINQEWHTEETVQIADGEASFTGFKGTYQVHVPGYAPARAELTGTAAAPQIRLTPQRPRPRRENTSILAPILGLEHDLGPQAYRRVEELGNGLGLHLRDGGWAEYTVSAQPGMYDIRLEGRAVGETARVRLSLDGKPLVTFDLPESADSSRAETASFVHVPRATGHPLRLEAIGGDVEVRSIQFLRPVIEVAGRGRTIEPDTAHARAEWGTLLAGNDDDGTFTIRNRGNIPLVLDRIELTGPDRDHFRVTPPGEGRIAPGSAMSFTVERNGARSTAKAFVKIVCNDQTQTPFFFAVEDRP